MKLQRLVFLAVAALLAGCETAPERPMSTVPAAPPRATTEPAGPAEFERQQRVHALAMERQGAWPEAALAWEVLSLLRPDAEYRNRLADARRRIDMLAAERLVRARAEQKRGGIESAEVLYLSVLSLQPDNTEAVEALRSIDRARNRRDYLGRPTRITAVRVQALKRLPKSTYTPDPGDPLELEHATLLAQQGELNEPIATMERRVKANPRDEAARRLLVDLYAKRAQSLKDSDVAGARVAVRRALALDREHAGALALQRQLGVTPRAVAPAGGGPTTAPTPAGAASAP